MTDTERVAHPMGDEEVAFRFGPEVDVADGEHPALLVGLSSMMVNWDGEDRERIRWDFAPQDVPELDDGTPALVSAWTSRNTGEKSTARRWIAAVLGAEAIANGVTVKAGDLAGKLCRIVVVHDDKGWPKVDLVLASKR
jgi:hypothetical protein